LSPISIGARQIELDLHIAAAIHRGDRQRAGGHAIRIAASSDVTRDRSIGSTSLPPWSIVGAGSGTVDSSSDCAIPDSGLAESCSSFSGFRSSDRLDISNSADANGSAYRAPARRHRTFVECIVETHRLRLEIVTEYQRSRFGRHDGLPAAGAGKASSGKAKSGMAGGCVRFAGSCVRH
jgi:hypothetical protein